MMEENGLVSKANHVGKKRNFKMNKIIAVIAIFFLFQTISNASNKKNILEKKKQTT